MRIAIYDKYWDTAGGGERYAAAIARCLSRDHDVELLVGPAADLSSALSKLGVDLGSSSIRQLTHFTERDVEMVSADYDCFVNATFGSEIAPLSKHSLFVSFFPVQSFPPLSASDMGAGKATAGFSFVEVGPHGYFRHFSSGARLLFPASDEKQEVRIEAYNPVPWVPVTDISIDFGNECRTFRLTNDPQEIRLTLPPSSRPTAVVLRGRNWRASGMEPGDDRMIAGAICLGQPKDGARFRFPDTYSKVVTISAFVQEWTQRNWQVTGELLFPPVEAYPSGNKAKRILAVGRFFEGGHSKKQLEMVEAFRNLSVEFPEWTLTLVGGCEHRSHSYLEKVSKAAVGLPVEILANASFETVQACYAESSVFWHLAGIGEDPDRNPVSQEHFGITTVEAMSAGCVPVVIGSAGQQEIVTSGRDGYLVDSVEELIQTTRRLLSSNEALWSSLRSAAKSRSMDFSYASFDTRLREIFSTLEGR